jgi:hypothetical protein
VKGIPVFWKAALFAGRCRNEGLGRSDSSRGQSSRGTRRAGDSGCPEDAEEGNAVGMRDLCVCTRRRHERSSHAPGDASFARSSDPYTSILTMLRGRKLSEVGRRQGHHGWENSRKREEPSLGSRSLDVVRLAACHRSSPPAREGA